MLRSQQRVVCWACRRRSNLWFDLGRLRVPAQSRQATRIFSALHFLYYNFVRIHQTLKVTPAMAAGVTDRLWEMTNVVKMIEAWEATGQRKAA